MDSPVFSIACLLAAAYVLLIGLYWYFWAKAPHFTRAVPFTPSISLSVLVPASNEANRILHCLDAIDRCQYPAHLMEIIVLENGSRDQTAATVDHWIQVHPDTRVRLVSLGTAGKKAALTTGVNLAIGQYIVCTDADCIPPESWLLHLAQVIEEEQPRCIAGPVVFHRESNLLDWFQSLDLMGMMGITGAGISGKWQHLANGANLAYEKATFMTVGGYEGNAHIASGDDVFLVQKIAQQWPGSVVFLKSAQAAVLTDPMPDINAFVAQRIRWGSKNAALPEWPVRLSALLVFVTCWSIILLALSAAFEASFKPAFMVLFLSKTCADFLFLGAMSRFFNKNKAMRWFLPAQVLHILYIALVGALSLFKKNAPWREQAILY